MAKFLAKRKKTHTLIPLNTIILNNIIKFKPLEYEKSTLREISKDYLKNI